MTQPRYPETVHLNARPPSALVRCKGLSTCIAPVAERIEADDLRGHDFDKTARVASHSDVGVIELVPIADATQLAFKYVSGHPANHRHGLPTVLACGVLAEVDTGVPRLLSELMLTPAIRTAAVPALAARVLARRDSTRTALIGEVAQSEFQALALRDLVGSHELRLFDTDAAASTKLAANLVDEDLQVRICASTAEAVRGTDVVTTVTADRAMTTILTPETR